MPTQSPRFDWRQYLPVHPAADLFPLMAEVELKGLAEDIKAHGVIEPVILFETADDHMALLDGRNRLDACALAGLLSLNGDGNLQITTTDGRAARLHYWLEHKGRDPYALALSYNVHRRHLTSEQKRDLIAKLLKAKPELSLRQVGKLTKTDKKKVKAVRTKMEATGVITPVGKTVGADGKARKQPEKKARPVKAVPDRRDDRVVDQNIDDPAASAEQMKAAHAAADGVEERDHKENRELTLSFEELINQIYRARRMAEALPKLLVLDNLSDCQRRELLPAIHERGGRCRRSASRDRSRRTSR
jgi:ParB-like nuclease domain